MGTLDGLSVFSDRFHKIIRADGKFQDVPSLIPLIEYDIKIPVFDDRLHRINKFYKSLADECIKYAENELCAKSALEYARSSDPKKRYRYKRIVYSLTFSIADYGSESVEIAVSVRVSSGTGSGTVIRFSRDVSHIWDTEKILLIPPARSRPFLSLKKQNNKQRESCEQKNQA